MEWSQVTRYRNKKQNSLTEGKFSSMYKSYRFIRETRRYQMTPTWHVFKMSWSGWSWGRQKLWRAWRSWGSKSEIWRITGRSATCHAGHDGLCHAMDTNCIPSLVSVTWRAPLVAGKTAPRRTRWLSCRTSWWAWGFERPRPRQSCERHGRGCWRWRRRSELTTASSADFSSFLFF